MLHHLPKTGVVIPCYKEAHRLPKEEFISFAKTNPGIVLLFVNDGSKDETLAVLNDLKKQAGGNIDVLDLKSNVGKAEAVRLGINHIIDSRQMEYVGFLDADLATSLVNYKNLVDFIQSNKNSKMVCGSRIRRMGADIDRKFFRHYMGRFIATIAGLFIVKIPVYDTQCGAKVFTVEFARTVFRDPFVSPWLFDMEIFCRSTVSFGYESSLKSIYEFPLNEWKDVGGSKISLKAMVSVPLEMMKIYLKYSSAMKRIS